MATGADKRSVFAVYVEKAPAPIEPLPEAISPAARILLNWLQQRGKTTICARDIQAEGPRVARSKASTAKLTETLEKRGWLLPLRSHRHDRWAKDRIGPGYWNRNKQSAGLR